MDDKTLEEQQEFDCAENECEIDEIDIVSDLTEHSKYNELNEVKSEQISTFATTTTSSGSIKPTECVETMAVDSGLAEDDEDLSKDETDGCKSSNDNCLQKVEFNSLDEGVPDENDVYSRFYFESDHLALKDSADYRLLLQTLVALEAQRKQAIKGYEKLLTLRKEILAEPVKFVEKLQNNEPLDIPSRQNVIKVPQINWEVYSGAIDDFSQLGLMHRHNTRHATGTAASLERANQRWEEQSATSNGSFGDGSQESIRFTSSIDSSRVVRGKLATSDKPLTFNQPWTVEEQRKLERLLQVYPQEPVEAKRWSKIANALGNRTTKQVASRVQKYFIKLARSGLPIPGREPNLTRVLPKPVPRVRSSQQQAVSFHNSTFFPSCKPRVYMEDNEKSDDNSLDSSDDLADISDDETIPKELRNTKEYWEILQLKRLKRRRDEQRMLKKDTVAHIGYICDLCGLTPIVGVRWHCVECPSDRSTDLCGDCVNNASGNGVHRSSHKMEPLDWPANEFVDGDYVKLGESSKGYNYLDPNFLPAAT